jgi:hypothetical protein
MLTIVATDHSMVHLLLNTCHYRYQNSRDIQILQLAAAVRKEEIYRYGIHLSMDATFYLTTVDLLLT